MMAVDLHNRDDEELVPLQLLTGEDNTLTIPVNKPINCQDWSYWSALSDNGSVVSSPIDSELGSSESSEEDDDYIAELTRKMALYMLQDDDNTEKENKSCSNQEEDLHVIGKFEKEKEKGSDVVPQDSDSERFSSPSTESTSESAIEKDPDFKFQSKQALIDKQIQDMKQQWGSKFNVNKQNGIEGRACGGFVNGQKTLSWPNLVQQTSYSKINSDVRAVFLDNQTGSRTGCSGTGVFLPRRIGNTSSDSRRKTGCPTVLIPAKVVQALKLHFDKMSVPARPNGIIFQSPASRQRQSQAMTTTSDQEMGLPQEWTY
ncbi:hypothetical protein HS088_TW07G00131 [Tripterygium wilfordii]|uniref:Uncharacterized protein n=1 Tax=Tripterygium wilfordii TaxID=458696 RepID=A0A7J7DE72_TRIWF|nr:uncharacterized protein LOC120001766 [Tripterygium wilfordii]KAF5744558.1 hypothetical protein HS088_TW07G00131 [Tripterygium wilfordii]